MTIDFSFHRLPREDQLRGFELAKDAEYWAHRWDPRVGKSKVVLDTFVYNYLKGRVTALVVIAYPADVHLVWRDEAPKDISPDLYARTKLLVWQSSRMHSKRAQTKMAEFLTHDGPVILTMNCEAIITDHAWAFLRKIFARRRVLLTVDEDWATRWSARTRRLLALGRHPSTVMRRLLSGTMADEGPNDLYFPTTFLKPGCLGFTSVTEFRHHYMLAEEGYNRRTGTEYTTYTGTRNLEELNTRLSQFSDVAHRRGSNKVYQFRYFSLTDEQREVYDMLRDQYVAELSSGLLTVRNLLMRMTRLQMVARNYYPPEKRGVPCPLCDGTDDDCPTCEGLGTVVKWTQVERIDRVNPAAEALKNELRLSRGPAVVWCRFKQDCLDAEAAASSVREKVVRYDGSVHPIVREEYYEEFKRGEIDVIVATIKSGLRCGHDLSRAHLTIFYSNEFSLRERRQAEDRTEEHRSSDVENRWTDVVDLVAMDTRDVDVIEALRAKRELADLVMGNKVEDWL